MRILMTVPSLGREFGGPVGAATELAAALRRLGHDVRLVGAGRGEGAIPLGSVARFHATPVPRTLRPLRRSVPGADVVHLFGVRDPVGTYAALRAGSASVPYVIEPAGMFRRRLRSLRLKAAFDRTAGRTIARRAGAFVAESTREASEIVEAGVSAGRVHVRPYGVTPFWPLPERGALRARLGVAPNVPVVLTLARINAIKGLEVLADALADLPRVVGVIAGPDERDGTRDRLERLREVHGLRERLHVLDAGLWDGQKAQALADADVVCLPSASESFGLAAAEGACAGVPVVVSDACGVVDVLDPATSRVVPFGDAPALAHAIGDLVTTEGIARAARVAASGLREALDWDVIAARQLVIYEDAGSLPSPRT